MQPAKADERRISDIERFLASSERSLFQQQQQRVPQQQQQQPQLQPQQQQSPLVQQILQEKRPKISSLAASAPSLTSILSAPPLATPSGRPLPPSTASTSGSSGSSSSSLQKNGSSGGGGVGAGNPVNLVPRMNELLQQVPPNVSIPDTPDLDSLILLQERRRRISSGGGQNTVKIGQPQASVQPALPTGRVVAPPQALPPPNQQASFNTQPTSGPPGGHQGQKGQLLMQQLTSGPSRGGGSIQPLTMSRSISYIEATPSTGNLSQQPQLYVQGNNGTPQVLARRSSFSGISPVGSISPVSTSGSGLLSSPPPPPGPPPPSGAAAAAAAAVAAASAGVLGQTQTQSQQLSVQQVARNLPQRHASGGGTVHHGGQPQQRQPQLQILGAASVTGQLHRRLSDSVEMKSDDKQRSLLQQLLSE